MTGQRPDGYHLLDMLVTFADCGDRLGFLPAQADTFTLSGPFGETLASDGSNLVLRARDLLREAVGALAFPVHIHLQKNLPIASGIGGGSADAAATLRGLMRLWGMSLPVGALASLALKLGADVPMCLESRPLIARGIGERIEAVPDLPAFAMVLVNPLQGVSRPRSSAGWRQRTIRRSISLAVCPRPAAGSRRSARPATIWSRRRANWCLRLR